jgi:hypothetical protein
MVVLEIKTPSVMDKKISIFLIFLTRKPRPWAKKWWREQDLNLCTRERADLQSAAINRSAIPPQGFSGQSVGCRKKPFGPAVKSVMSKP